MASLRCAHCGYDLAGVPREAGAVRCPECGREQPAVEYPPWPAPWKPALWCCGPVLVLGLAGAMLPRFLPNAVLATVALLPAAAAGLVAPAAVGDQLAYQHEPEGPPRRRAWLRIALAGWAVNAVQLVAYAMIARAAF